MKELIKRELLIGAQYLMLLRFALVVAFFAEITKSGVDSDAINIAEAWKSIEPYVVQVVKAFVVLTLIRLLIVTATFYFAHCKRDIS